MKRMYREPKEVFEISFIHGNEAIRNRMLAKAKPARAWEVNAKSNEAATPTKTVSPETAILI
jgi:hypothetical protein